MLKEINRLISEEKQLATIKNTFFVNITESLDLKKDSDSSLNLFDSENKISQTFMINKKSSFKFVTEDLVRKEIMNLDGSKATPIGDISVNILKTVDIHLVLTANTKSLSIENGCFAEELKLDEVSPIFKKKDDLLR